MDTTDDCLTTDIFGVPPFTDRTPAGDLLDGIGHCARWQSHLAWAGYTRAARLHALVAHTVPQHDLRIIDDQASTAVRLAAQLHLSKSAADAMLREALALIHRIPRIGQCLHDGIITQRQYQQLVTLTDLLEGHSHAADVDAAIAHELRRTNASSSPRLRDLADRIIFRHDPDAVRHRRDKAIRDRSAGSVRLRDGMSRIGITASAEDTALAMAAVEALANSVCSHDPRTKNARRSDAAISKLQETPFDCQCDRPDCAATIDERSLSDRHARIVLHAIWETPLPRGPVTQLDRSHQLGFLDGHGVISADHASDIAARPDTIIRQLNPHPSQPLPAHLPSDPYRFSTALATFIRARDAYCVFPGCNAPAWAGDIDHVTEYNHRDPEAGGQTSAVNGNVKCRYHHIVKTFGDWLDDQYIGPDGLTHIETITPEGHRIHGHGHTNESLFPALKNIQFQAPPRQTIPEPQVAPENPAKANVRVPAAGPQRRRSRHAEKLARRRHERARNKIERDVRNHASSTDP